MDTHQAFFEAIQAGDRKKVTELLEGEPSLLNARGGEGTTPVLTAMYYGKPEIADLLFSLGADLDIFEAAAAGKLERLKELVEEQSASVNAYAEDGFQPLGLASFFGHLDCAKFLIEKGAGINSPSKNPLRVMPLNSAAAAQHLEIAKMLLAHGADANARQEGGFTPLHSAAQNQQVEMIALLLSYSADLNAMSDEGKTPLEYAGESARPEVIDLLTTGRNQ